MTWLTDRMVWASDAPEPQHGDLVFVIRQEKYTGSSGMLDPSVKLAMVLRKDTEGDKPSFKLCDLGIPVFVGRSHHRTGGTLEVPDISLEEIEERMRFVSPGDGWLDSSVVPRTRGTEALVRVMVQFRRLMHRARQDRGAVERGLSAILSEHAEALVNASKGLE
jgi:hypothetical protein